MENEQNVESQENTEATENSTGTEEVEEVKDPQGLLRSYRRVTSEAKQHREAKEALEAKIAELEGDEGIARWKSRAIKTEVRSALKEQGIKDPSRIMEFLSLEGVDIDNDDKLVGLDDAITALKKKLPELFNTKRQVSPVNVFEGKKTEQKKDGTQAQVDFVLGNNRK